MHISWIKEDTGRPTNKVRDGKFVTPAVRVSRGEVFPEQLEVVLDSEPVFKKFFQWCGITQPKRQEVLFLEPNTITAVPNSDDAVGRYTTWPAPMVGDNLSSTRWVLRDPQDRRRRSTILDVCQTIQATIGAASEFEIGAGVPIDFARFDAAATAGRSKVLRGQINAIDDPKIELLVLTSFEDGRFSLRTHVDEYLAAITTMVPAADRRRMEVAFVERDFYEFYASYFVKGNRRFRAEIERPEFSLKAGESRSLDISVFNEEPGDALIALGASWENQESSGRAISNILPLSAPAIQVGF